MRVSSDETVELKAGLTSMLRQTRQTAAVVLCLVIAAVGGVFFGARAMIRAESADVAVPQQQTSPSERSAVQPDSRSDESEKARGRSTAVPASVLIRRPAGPPRIQTGLTDIDGKDVTVACSTCHATRQPDFQNRTSEDLDEFHGGTAFTHGTVSCLSCHNERDYDSLKLADGGRVEFTDVMTLCAQCHGAQMTAYEHGAHGGMTGYWDLNRGPRVRNNCIDCHDPHAPQFPKMVPTFKPRDRFLNSGEN